MILLHVVSIKPQPCCFRKNSAIATLQFLFALALLQRTKGFTANGQGCYKVYKKNEAPPRVNSE